MYQSYYEAEKALKIISEKLYESKISDMYVSYNSEVLTVSIHSDKTILDMTIHNVQLDEYDDDKIYAVLNVEVFLKRRSCGLNRLNDYAGNAIMRATFEELQEFSKSSHGEDLVNQFNQLAHEAKQKFLELAKDL